MLTVYRARAGNAVAHLRDETRRLAICANLLQGVMMAAVAAVTAQPGQQRRSPAACQQLDQAPGGRPQVPCLAPQARRVTEDFLCLGRGVGDAHSGSSHRGVQTARLRTNQMVTAISSIESASSQPLSIHWNGQNRLAGW